MFRVAVLPWSTAAKLFDRDHWLASSCLTEGMNVAIFAQNDFTPEEEAKIAEENAWVKELCPED